MQKYLEDMQVKIELLNKTVDELRLILQPVLTPDFVEMKVMNTSTLKPAQPMCSEIAQMLISRNDQLDSLTSKISAISKQVEL